ncbi:MAG: 4Fe-4S dicluster domain-containing protein [Kiritimatiellia bacterium]|jgi:putative selenate reductase|nr:4Fe-4S dicluster domain-containing protein [Kiritimatiellia bacterium]MDP6631755.1 4Fe-4S dicluster domain-containing protein [Kiritimatiellia bacterium]MDP6810491.1 4Fe-4S dicluster domain-containing protein [Kiritimatiellia bacterium]MDP7024991.1 4Fe-4S dicluster domain-containing protein [Kiritimatiellia bacterium]
MKQTVSDKFQPIPLESLAAWIFGELEQRNSVFGIPRESFFVPSAEDRFRGGLYGACLETPLGVAAGPHSQMAQNIISAWLCGARFIELKTVQILDELQIPKPCIAIAGAGFNVEWSQELKLEQSFEEYLRAWVLIHVLHRVLEFPGDSPGVIFNMSVGYDLAGIRQPNMQAFLRNMRDASEHVHRARGVIERCAPSAADISVPAQISNSVTLSTMHGCPPDEIGRIAAELMTEWRLHTSIKLNPTLLGPARVREILVADPRTRELEVPDEAFEHDLHFDQAVALVRELQGVASQSGTELRIKVSNTLEVTNPGILSAEESRVYMSGPPLHAVSVALASKLAETFPEGPDISFCAGACADNIADLLAGGLYPVTVCTDLLKARSYRRLGKYLAKLDEAMEAADAADIPAYIRRAADRKDVREAARRSLGAYAERAVAALADVRERSKREKKTQVLPLFDCRDKCGICAGVCPNRAIQTYSPVAGEDTPSYDPQVAVFADFCNECGNCASVCPSGGKPYKEKPRLYLDRKQFEAEEANAFHVVRKNGVLSIQARSGGETCERERPLTPALSTAMLNLLRAFGDSLAYLPAEDLET